MDTDKILQTMKRIEKGRKQKTVLMRKDYFQKIKKKVEERDGEFMYEGVRIKIVENLPVPYHIISDEVKTANDLIFEPYLEVL